MSSALRIRVARHVRSKTNGLRTVEVSRSDVTDIQKSGDHFILRVLGKGRDEKSDFVRLSTRTHQAILSYLDGRESGPIFISTSNNSRGERLSTRSISRIIKDRMKAIGINSPRYSAHSLRHSCCTLNLLAGGSLQESSQLLRHRSLATTQIYSHNLTLLSNPSSQRVEDYLFAQEDE